VTRDQCRDYLVSAKGVPEEAADAILDVLSLHGPYEVRVMLRPNAVVPLVVRSLRQGEFEVRLTG
jgi:hypothetical protein